MPSTASLTPAAIALNRFGLGARPGDPVPADPKRWLLDQLASYQPKSAAFDALPDAADTLKAYYAGKREARRAKADEADTDGTDARKRRQAAQNQVRALYRDGVSARVESALQTDTPFAERLVHFWSNHFCVSADNARTTAYIAAFERDAIRPHILGRFQDMLLAVERHPAMLVYLNQNNSIGPNSVAAKRLARRRERTLGLNENLGREAMELHTLGVRSGYTQTDVTEFSRALTGWTVDGLGARRRVARLDGGFVFRPALHEPGARHIMGKVYDQQGEAQARAALVDFARSPKTGVHVATKLARHFASDTPSDALVARLATAFNDSGGDLPTVYRALIDSPETWSPRPVKFKTPWEWTISAFRGVGRRRAGKQIAGLQKQLGQPTWKPGSPAGWDDIAASWAAPDALLRRVEWASQFGAAIGDRVDARALGPKLIPASLSPATAQQVARSESPANALALLLVSPDFLRR